MDEKLEVDAIEAATTPEEFVEAIRISGKRFDVGGAIGKRYNAAEMASVAEALLKPGNTLGREWVEKNVPADILKKIGEFTQPAE